MKKVLVLGASFNEKRYSNMAMKKLLKYGHKVMGIGAIAGSLDEAKVFTEPKTLTGIHTVSVYLNSVNQRSFYDYIIDLNPERVIFNPGSENIEFEELLREKNIFFEKACTLVMLSLNQF
ncbi:CoA-binding protein [Lutimonas sp.]|uniref:CoA-binding protein n=1 Tax=Lutimonas sp. TaxID=1872403 RepID=UPI003D9B9905